MLEGMGERILEETAVVMTSDVGAGVDASGQELSSAKMDSD